MSKLLSTSAPFETALNSFLYGGSRGCRTIEPSLLSPRADISEYDDHFLLEIDLPGVKRDGVEVSVEKGTLSLKAQRKSAEDEKNQAIRTERHSRAEFQRSFQLGDSIDPDGIEGRLEDGVLVLKLAKRERALPRRIEVN